MHFPAAMVLYAVTVALAGLVFTLLWVHIAYLGHLLDDRVDARLRRYLLLRFLSVPGGLPRNPAARVLWPRPSPDRGSRGSGG